MCPFSKYTYASFPNLILSRVTNYWLVLMYDFTVSGLLKIKLSGSVCFHRACPKTLVFQSINSRLTSIFVVLGHVINHSKRNFVSSPLHRNDLSRQRWRGNLFIEEWPQDFHERTFCVKSGFSSGNSPSQLQNWLAQKHSYSRYHFNNILGRYSAAKSYSKGSITTKAITRRQVCCPPRKSSVYLSINTAAPETRDIKNIKVNSFIGSSILFSSVN